jgi:inner membrane protein
MEDSMKEKFGLNFKEWTETVLFKGIVALFLAFLVLIPIGQVENLLRERENRMYEVKEEVISRWGGWQYIAGPIIVIPIIEFYEENFDDKKVMVQKRHFFHLLPEELNISGNFISETRSKGIYNIELYTGSLNISGNFDKLQLPDFSYSSFEVLWDETELLVGLGDVKGLSRKADFKWNNEDYDFSGGGGQSSLFTYGIHTTIPLQIDNNYTFEIDLEIRGGEYFTFLPLGNETNVNINSNWKSPNFQGNFLPESHLINDKGFSAEWNIHSLARNFPQSWMDSDIDWNKLYDGSFGVKFINPVDGYFKNHRAIKYRLMFIFIPFIALFLFEILTKTRVHPFQYLLVGFSISIFFLLLLSISEHLSFNISYLLAAAASSMLISTYTASVFKSLNKGVIMAGANIILYTYLFISLISEDYALLIGSIGLLVILSITMLVTRKLNWYKI